MTIAALLSESHRRFQSGDLHGARELAEEALIANPRHLPALRLAGTLACHLSDLGRAKTLLGTALSIAPGDLSSRVNLAQLLLAAGDTAAARQVASAGNGHLDLVRLQALAARASGDLESAEVLFRQVLDREKADVIAWNGLGNALLGLGRPEEAATAFAEADALRPGDPTIKANLALALARRGDPETAIATLQRAAADAPQDVGILRSLALALIEVERWNEALPVLGTAARLHQGDPEILRLLGVTFENLGDRQRAEQSYRFALRAMPGHEASLLNLGILLESDNRLQELQELVDAAPAEDASDERRYLRALIARREGRLQEAFDLANGLSTHGAVDPQTRHAFLGQLADRLGDSSRAFDEFTSMHAAASRTSSSGSDEAWKEVLSWREGLDRQTAQGWPSVPVPDQPSAPAFLVGFMRSGTTLLDTMLMGHPQAHVLEELPIISRLARSLGSPAAAANIDATTALRLRDAYFKELEGLAPPPPGKLVIDKFPMATLNSPLIARLFPQARVIFALRHPCDVVLSCFMQNFRLSRTMASFLNIEDAAHYYASVMSFWTLARERLPLAVHVIRYESLLTDTEAELRSLTDFLGLPFSPKLLDHQNTAFSRGHIRTPSYHQVTEGLYQRSDGRWRRYLDQLAPALPILAPWVERFGYEPLS
jgi:Flp pilus assembly protein TadD